MPTNNATASQIVSRLIEIVDQEKAEPLTDPDQISQMAYELHSWRMAGYGDEVGQRMKCVSLGTRESGFGNVNIQAYLLDDYLVAFSFQPGNEAFTLQTGDKNRRRWLWHTRKDAMDVMNFLRSVGGDTDFPLDVFDPRSTTIPGDWIAEGNEHSSQRPSSK